MTQFKLNPLYKEKKTKFHFEIPSSRSTDDENIVNNLLQNISTKSEISCNIQQF